MNISITELKQMYMEDHRRRYPNLPEPARVAPTYNDKTANGLTRCITDYLKLKGAFVSRVNNTGIYDAKIKRYRRGMNRRGLPDIIATYQGISLFIEVKAGKDKLSEYQKQIKTEQEGSGGMYHVAYNFADFRKWFATLQ